MFVGVKGHDSSYRAFLFSLSPLSSLSLSNVQSNPNFICAGSFSLIITLIYLYSPYQD